MRRHAAAARALWLGAAGSTTRPSLGCCCTSCCCGRCGPRRSARSLRQSRPLATTHSNAPRRERSACAMVPPPVVVQLGRTARSYSSIRPPEKELVHHTLTAHGCKRRARAVSLLVCRAMRSACERVHGSPVTARTRACPVRYLLLGHPVAQQVVRFLQVQRVSVTHTGAAHVWRHEFCTRCCASPRLESASTGAHSLTTADIHCPLHEPQSRCRLDNEPSSRRAVRMTGSKVWRAVSD